MTGYRPYQKAGLLIDYNGSPHLFVTMNDPCPDGLCLLIMVTSVKQGRHYDSACVLDVGDHPFIRHPSFCLYRLAECIRAQHIAKMVDAGVYATKADFSPTVFVRIASGLYASPEVRPRIVTYARAQGV
jgi:hypothetical protein